MTKKALPKVYAVWMEEPGGSFKFIGNGQFKDDDPMTEHILVRPALDMRPGEAVPDYKKRLKSEVKTPRGIGPKLH